MLFRSVRGVAVGEPVRLIGAIEPAGSANNTTIALQQMTNRRWSDVATQRSQDDGSYAFLRIFDNPTNRVYRTVASKNGKRLAVSATQRVTVSSRPKPSGTTLSVDLGAKKLPDSAARATMFRDRLERGAAAAVSYRVDRSSSRYP